MIPDFRCHITGFYLEQSGRSDVVYGLKFQIYTRGCVMQLSSLYVSARSSFNFISTNVSIRKLIELMVERSKDFYPLCKPDIEIKLALLGKVIDFCKILIFMIILKFFCIVQTPSALYTKFFNVPLSYCRLSLSYFVRRFNQSLVLDELFLLFVGYSSINIIVLDSPPRPPE